MYILFSFEFREVANIDTQDYDKYNNYEYMKKKAKYGHFIYMKNNCGNKIPKLWKQYPQATKTSQRLV